MKKKQKEEIRVKSLSELAPEVGKREGEIQRLEMEIKMGKVKNTSSLKHKKDELALVKTIMKEKRLQNENI